GSAGRPAGGSAGPDPFPGGAAEPVRTPAGADPGAVRGGSGGVAGRAGSSFWVDAGAFVLRSAAGGQRSGRQSARVGRRSSVLTFRRVGLPASGCGLAAYAFFSVPAKLGINFGAGGRDKPVGSSYTLAA